MFLLLRFFSYLPLPLLHLLGAATGWLVWLSSSRYRRITQENLQQAGLEHVRNRTIAENGKSILEIPKIWMQSNKATLQMVRQVHGWEYVEAARKAHKGILYLTPHLGCFEILARYLRVRPCADGKSQELTVLWRPLHNKAIARLIERGRGRNVALATPDLGGVRRLLKVLKQREACGLLPDQVPSNGEGIWAPFFGRPAYTMLLAARLAETGATVLITYAERLPRGKGFHIHFLPLSQPLNSDLPERVTHINREIETIIRRCPAQYTWSYNRYKHPKGAPLPPTTSPTKAS